MVIDTRPLARAAAGDAASGATPNLIARRFHGTLVAVIAGVCERLRGATVVLSGGVFLNSLLTTEVNARLTRGRFRVYRHRRVPPNDGGLSLGQLAVAAAVLKPEIRMSKSERNPNSE